jgi:uridine kinase
VVEQYLATVKPMHELFVEPSKRAADVIILEGAFNEVALDLIMKKIEAHLRR